MAYASWRSLFLLLILLTLAIEDSHAQFFVLTGNMTTSRIGHTATLLQDGRVLIAGGYVGIYRTTAEIYDPVTGTFAETGAMAASRAYHAAVLLQDGRVLLAGGICNKACSPGAELYDPATGTFTSTGNMIAWQQTGYSAVLLKNGKALVGNLSSAELYTFELFDPATGAFTPLTTNAQRITQYSLYGIGMTLLPDGEVLLSSGAELLLYDPANDGFRQLPIRWNLAGTTATPLLDGSVFLAGGYTDTYGNIRSARTYVYDPAIQILETKADLLFARNSHTATLLKDGRVLIAGGFNENYFNTINDTLADADLYDPTTGKMSYASGMVMGHAEHVATLLQDGRVLITGGQIYSRFGNPVDTTSELFIPKSTQGVVPRLELDSRRYCAGDSWTLRAESMAPLTSVQISGTRDGSPWTISDWKTSGEDGTLVATGTYDPGAVGNYTVWLYSGGKTSNTASVTVESCSVHLDLMNSKFPMFHTEFYRGDSWTVHVMSSSPGSYSARMEVNS